MVFSLLLARSGWFHIRELMTYRQVLGTALILAGVTLVSVFGPHSTAEPTMAELLEDFNDPGFLLFASLTLLMVALYLAVLFWSPLRRYKPSPNSQLRTGLSAYSAAVCGAESQLFLKVVSVGMRELAVGDPDAVTEPAFCISVIGLGLTAPLQLFLLNATLASSPVSYAVPVYQALLIILTTAAGGVFFREFAHFPFSSAVVFLTGLFVAIVGLGLLSAKSIPGVRATRTTSQTEFVEFNDELPQKPDAYRESSMSSQP